MVAGQNNIICIKIAKPERTDDKCSILERKVGINAFLPHLLSPDFADFFNILLYFSILL